MLTILKIKPHYESIVRQRHKTGAHWSQIHHKQSPAIADSAKWKPHLEIDIRHRKVLGTPKF